MAIDPNVLSRINTNFGQQLGQVFDPYVQAEKQNALADLMNQRKMREMQVMQQQAELQRAPILQQREEQAILARQQEEQRKREMLAQLTPEQQRIYALGGGAKLAETMMPERMTAADRLAREKFEFDKRRGNGGGDVNWQAVQTDQGLVQINPKTGEIRSLGISKALPGSKLTEGQAKATTYASQMQSASNTLSDVEQAGFEPTSLKGQLQVGMAGGMTNILAPAQAQQYKQAQEQWAESFLRAKTGAAATREEVELNRKTFFPQPGDAAEVIQQKKLARAQAERDVLNMAGAGRELATPRNEQPAGQSAMQNMPPPQSASGRTVRDTSTGIRYKSDGSRWVRVE